MKIKKYHIYTWFIFLIFVFLCGCAVGAILFGFLHLMNLCIDTLWIAAKTHIKTLVYPLIICIIGGLVIGLWRKRVGDYPKDMDTIMAGYKKNGSIPYNNVPLVCFSALLPLVFGASIGPEAGLTGALGGLVCWVRDKYKSAALTVLHNNALNKHTSMRILLATPAITFIGVTGEVDGKPFTIRKYQRYIIYATSILGGLITMSLINHLFPKTSLVFMRFSGFSLGKHELIAIVPLIILGILLGLFFRSCERIFKYIFRDIKKKWVISALIGGGCLGVFGIFSNEHVFRRSFYDAARIALANISGNNINFNRLCKNDYNEYFAGQRLERRKLSSAAVLFSQHGVRHCTYSTNQRCICRTRANGNAHTAQHSVNQQSFLLRAYFTAQSRL